MTIHHSFHSGSRLNRQLAMSTAAQFVSQSSLLVGCAAFGFSFELSGQAKLSKTERSVTHLICYTKRGMGDTSGNAVDRY